MTLRGSSCSRCTPWRRASSRVSGALYDSSMAWPWLRLVERRLPPVEPRVDMECRPGTERCSPRSRALIERRCEVDEKVGTCIEPESVWCDVKRAGDVRVCEREGEGEREGEVEGEEG